MTLYANDSNNANDAKIAVDYAVAARPRPDQALGGDLTFCQHNATKVILLCMDVLGHGSDAWQVAQQAHHWLAQQTQLPEQPKELLDQLHLELNQTRGAAVSVCSIDINSATLTFAGVGNVAVRRLFPSPQSMVSRDGIIGVNMRTPRQQQQALTPGDIYIMHTDGIGSRFGYSDHRRMISDSAITCADHFLHQYGKNHDDAACIVIKITEQGLPRD